MDGKRDLVVMAADIVRAFISANKLAPEEVPAFIASVHAALVEIAGEAPAAIVPNGKPAIAQEESVTPDFIVCLEDGKQFKSLKRHLRTRYGMTPDEYRAKWGLPHDYPMVAPNYAKERSILAKRSGLGQGKRDGGLT